jgi:hypothetical protein
MRRILVLGLVLTGALAGSSQSARAQSLGAAALFSDPFLAYYGYFVPQQLVWATRPRPEDTVRQYSAARQYTALTDRASLYDPIGALGIEDDPLRAFGSSAGSSRLPMTSPTGLVNNNINGTGPAGYYNRVNNYYPTLRMGRGGNGGLSPISSSPRGRNMGGGSQPINLSGYGMPSVPNAGGFR